MRGCVACRCHGVAGQRPALPPGDRRWPPVESSHARLIARSAMRAGLGLLPLLIIALQVASNVVVPAAGGQLQVPAEG
ncbi:hypothetical protein G6F35_012067 [Rhizopus arrhizus]|nr:hypothetical protein G6F35_012067 [Rhizopus arrhizus]